MSRALSVDNIRAIKYSLLEFDGEWQEFVNQPERAGIWFVYATSTSGKSSFVMMLAKYLTKFGHVLYNAREEGREKTKVMKSFRDRMERYEMQDVKSRFHVVNEDLPAFQARLDKRRSPQTIIIDSIQYFKMTFKEYEIFKNRNEGKTIIIVSHAKGGQPLGRLAEQIMFDAYIKIWVEGYKAISKGREIGSKGEITIWEEGANKYWGEQI